MGGNNYFLYLKSRKIFSSMSLVPSKMAKMSKWGVFGAKRNVPDDVEGVYDHQFFFEIRLVRYLGDPFAKL